MLLELGTHTSSIMEEILSGGVVFLAAWAGFKTYQPIIQRIQHEENKKICPMLHLRKWEIRRAAGLGWLVGLIVGILGIYIIHL
jgi:hypothetical protein